MVSGATNVAWRLTPIFVAERFPALRDFRRLKGSQGNPKRYRAIDAVGESHAQNRANGQETVS